MHGFTENCFRSSLVEVPILSKTIARVPRCFDKFSHTKLMTVHRYYHMRDVNRRTLETQLLAIFFYCDKFLVTLISVFIKYPQLARRGIIHNFCHDKHAS